MEFRIKLSARAKRDADDILVWLHERGADRTGIRWFLGLEDAIGSLKRMPARCPLAPEGDRFEQEVRELRYGRRLTSIEFSS